MLVLCCGFGILCGETVVLGVFIIVAFVLFGAVAALCVSLW